MESSSILQERFVSVPKSEENGDLPAFPNFVSKRKTV